MAEKSKRLARGGFPALDQLLVNLDNPEPSKRAWVMGECRTFAPYIEAILGALLRGLNDPDPDVRDLAIRGILCAFSSKEAALARLLGDVESAEPKVRLAAIDRLLIILPKILVGLSGRKPDVSSATSMHPSPVTEDLMEYAGRWVAWTQDRKRVVAVADSYDDVMGQAEEAGEGDPYVKKVPGVSPNTPRRPFTLLEDESSNIIDDVSKVFPDPDTWLDAPNSSLGGEKPRKLIGTEREQEMRYLLRGIRDGITT